MAKETSAPLTVTPPQRCATPRHASPRSPARCSPTSITKPLTSHRTTTARRRSRAFSHRVCRTCSSTAPLASPSAWQRTFRRTTLVRSPTPPLHSSLTQNSPLTISVSTSTRLTSQPAAFCTATTPSRIHSLAQRSASTPCDRCTRTDAAVSLLMAQHTSKRPRVAIAPRSSSPSFRTR